MTACYWPNWPVVFKLSFTVHSLCLISHAFKGWVGEIINTIDWMWQTRGEIGCGSVFFFWSKKFPKEDKKKKVIFLSQNSLKFKHLVITLVMKFHEILMWNKFIEEISLMYIHIPFIKYDSSIISFPRLNFIHVQWLNIHEISFVLWMKWDENSRSSQDHYFFFH